MVTTQIALVRGSCSSSPAQPRRGGGRSVDVAGIGAGNATVELEPPSRERFTASHTPELCFVAADHRYPLTVHGVFGCALAAISTNIHVDAS